MLTLNSPHVVHETIDGETILLHLKTGNYYSFDGVGALVWQNIIALGGLDELMDKVVLSADQKSEVEAFINNLLEEELLKEGDLVEIVAEEEQVKLMEQFEEAVKAFTPPVLKKYSDMQELLLLDPIHDVEDGEGWPEVKS